MGSTLAATLLLPLLAVACGGPAEPVAAPVTPPPPVASSAAPSGAPSASSTAGKGAEPSRGLALAVYRKDCDPVALTQTLDSQLLGFRVGYPAGWTVSMPAPDLPMLVKTGTEAQVAASHFDNGRPDLSTLDIIRETKLNTTANGQWRQLAIAGRPAASYWFTIQPPHPMCVGCGGPTGPDLAQLVLTTAMPKDTFVELHGSAPVTSPPALFCEMQAIIASFTLR